MERRLGSAYFFFFDRTKPAAFLIFCTVAGESFTAAEISFVVLPCLTIDFTASRANYARSGQFEICCLEEEGVRKKYGTLRWTPSIGQRIG